MGNRVNRIVVLASGVFRISQTVFEQLHRTLASELPEGSLFDDGWLETTDQRDGFIWPKKDIWWFGEGSASCLDVFLEAVLPQFEGFADLLVTFDYGEWEGYRLRNGRVTRHDVIITLGETV